MDRHFLGTYADQVFLYPGGSIGAGLFINSGAALAIGGPGSLFVSYIVISFMVYSTVQALGELAVM